MNDLYFLSKNCTNWRYERKFFISHSGPQAVGSIIRLHPACFSEIYQERYVNNIYFDTFSMTNYLDNVDGKSDRIKIRIRWYGEIFGLISKPVLEIKVKKGHLGSKLSYPISPFLLDDALSNNMLHNVIKHSTDIPDTIKLFLNSLDFALLNRYKRKYFQSNDKLFRITVDSELRFVQLSNSRNNFLNKTTINSGCILELKYSEAADSIAEKISNFFPFRMTRSSKYVSGVHNLLQLAELY